MKFLCVSVLMSFLVCLTNVNGQSSPINCPIDDRGDHVCNGGGIAEQNITFAYTNLGDFIQVCLQTGICDLQKEEAQTLTNIASFLDKEYSNKKQIIFKSELKEPGTFIIDNELKVAKTGDDIASPIYFNIDLLYFKNSLNQSEPISIPQAISILVHEMGHHHGIKDHTKLDLLGNKVAAASGKRFISSSLDPYTDDIKVSVFNQKKSGSFPTVLLYIHGGIYDISHKFKTALSCSIIGYDKKPKGSVYHNVFWALIKPLPHMKKLMIKGNLINECQDKFHRIARSKNQKVLIEFEVVPESGCTSTICKPNWKLKENSLSLKQITEPWWNNLYLNTEE